MGTTDNIRYYLKAKGLSIKDFVSSIGKSTAYLNNAGEFSMETLRDIAEKYPDLDVNWLITGKGEMFKSPNDNHGISIGNMDVKGSSSMGTYNAPVTFGHPPNKQLDDDYDTLKRKYNELDKKYHELFEKYTLAVKYIALLEKYGGLDEKNQKSKERPEGGSS